MRMPYGCGEQNMVNFSPNIYVLKYLQTVNQLTKSLENKAKGFMIAGQWHKSDITDQCCCPFFCLSKLLSQSVDLAEQEPW